MDSLNEIDPMIDAIHRRMTEIEFETKELKREPNSTNRLIELEREIDGLRRLFEGAIDDRQTE